MKIKAHHFFVLLCLVVFVLSVFIALTSSTGGVKTQALKEETVIAKQKEAGKEMFLEVNSPKNGEILTSETITIKGKTLPLAEVFVNEKEAVADSDGNFTVNLTLDEGENNLSLSANDVLGNMVEKELVVTVETF